MTNLQQLAFNINYNKLKELRQRYGTYVHPVDLYSLIVFPGNFLKNCFS